MNYLWGAVAITGQGRSRLGVYKHTQLYDGFVSDHIGGVLVYPQRNILVKSWSGTIHTGTKGRSKIVTMSAMRPLLILQATRSTT